MSQKYRMGIGEKIFLSVTGVLLTAGIIGIVVAIAARKKAHVEEVATQAPIPKSATADIGALVKQGQEQEKAAACNSNSIPTTEDDFLLVPGQRVGAIVFGQPIPESVMAKLGKPDFTSISTPQAVDAGNYTWENRLNVKLGDGHSQFNVFQVFIENGPYHTAQGIRIGSTMAEVKAAYPNAEQGISVLEERTTLKIPGLTFEMDPDGRKVSCIAAHTIR